MPSCDYAYVQVASRHPTSTSTTIATLHRLAAITTTIITSATTTAISNSPTAYTSFTTTAHIPPFPLPPLGSSTFPESSSTQLTPIARHYQSPSSAHRVSPLDTRPLPASHQSPIDIPPQLARSLVPELTSPLYALLFTVSRPSQATILATAKPPTTHNVDTSVLTTTTSTSRNGGRASQRSGLRPSK